MYEFSFVDFFLKIFVFYLIKNKINNLITNLHFL